MAAADWDDSNNRQRRTNGRQMGPPAAAKSSDKAGGTVTSKQQHREETKRGFGDPPGTAGIDSSWHQGVAKHKRPRLKRSENWHLGIGKMFTERKNAQAGTRRRSGSGGGEACTQP